MIARTSSIIARRAWAKDAAHRGAARSRSTVVFMAMLLFVVSIVLIGAAMALGMPAVRGGPMWALSARPSPNFAVTLQAIGLAAGTGAVAAGLVAVGRGWRPSVRLLIGVGAAMAAL